MINAIQEIEEVQKVEEKEESLWLIFKHALKHLFDSKTNTFLFILTLLAIFIAIIAAAVFGEQLWRELLYALGFNGGSSVVRSGVVDGAPKIAASIRDPNSIGANPPPSVSSPVFNPNNTGLSSAQINFDPNAVAPWRNER